MNTPALTLVSHTLCPYVQRAVITLTEKAIDHERVYIDLNDPPDWFQRISPLGRVPVLLVDGRPLFESAVIVEYLDETTPGSLHPADAFEKAQHRAWMEYGSSILDTIWEYYTAMDSAALERKRDRLATLFARLEGELGAGPYFGGRDFSLVDAVFGPVFRYFDVFERYGELGIFAHTPKVRQWRSALAARPSIQTAVGPGYGEKLHRFVIARKGRLGELALAWERRALRPNPDGPTAPAAHPVAPAETT